MNSFQLSGLPEQTFSSLFDLSDAELTARNIQRILADAQPGFPCRISLTDADVGEELLLLAFEHQPGPSPYRASGPIYVRRHAQQKILPVGVLSPYVTRRLISLRAYDANDSMVDAEVCEGSDLESHIEHAFADARIAYLHLHHAKRGCFLSRVDRVAGDS
ncbi:MAG: DUF1203 domain-containing protein [Dokdonella sp.]